MVTSPEFLIPPSEITGTSYSLDIFTLSRIAVNCGTPDPVITLVIQIDSDPTPTLTASTPALIKSSAPFPVAMLPAINSQSLNAFFIKLTQLTALSLCP